ncbi:unnamed protein product [Cyprideis torosa]|uniref:Uncharacterized protein n=1 Tax=Cyprideis torosa TaxID=163714 RepID=A0A7R8ZII8_9CRUS|nr:unnamed protein product [Cyprideis torosa]CAG0884855.1 unnamed protein product [Cyprideis torosa]
MLSLSKQINRSSTLPPHRIARSHPDPRSYAATAGCPIEGCEYYCTQLNNLKKHCASKHQTSEHGERLITIFRCQECPFSCNAAFQLKVAMSQLMLQCPKSDSDVPNQIPMSQIRFQSPKSGYDVPAQVPMSQIGFPLSQIRFRCPKSGYGVPDQVTMSQVRSQCSKLDSNARNRVVMSQIRLRCPRSGCNVPDQIPISQIRL